MADVPFLSGWIAVQAVPRLALEFGVSQDLPPERMLYGFELDELIRTIDEYETLLKEILREHGITWRKVYEASDVGKERLALAERLGLSRADVVLDAGCGKGFNTAALAYHSSRVCGLDLMNGHGRRGWWTNFRLAMDALELGGSTSGLRADATRTPFMEEAFTLAASSHALRNVGDEAIIVDMLGEMCRVTRKGGRVVVAENLPEAKTKAQEAHLRLYVLKTRLVRGDRPYRSEEDVVGIFEEAGLDISRREIIDFGLSAAPPIFALDTVRLSPTEKASIEEEYQAAVEMIQRHGESSPPVLILEAYI